MATYYGGGFTVSNPIEQKREQEREWLRERENLRGGQETSNEQIHHQYALLINTITKKEERNSDYLNKEKNTPLI